MQGRPTTASNEAIIEATIRAVGNVGPAHLTLADVANEAGLAPPTLIQRFGSKRGLLLAIAKQGPDRIRDVFLRFEKEKSPLEALFAALKSTVEPVSTPEEFANHLAFLQIDLSDPEFHEFAVETFNVTHDCIREFLDRAVKSEELKECDTDQLARAVHVAYNGALILWSVFRKGELADSLHQALNVVVEPYQTAR